MASPATSMAFAMVDGVGGLHRGPRAKLKSHIQENSAVFCIISLMDYSKTFAMSLAHELPIVLPPLWDRCSYEWLCNLGPGHGNSCDP